MDDLQHLAADYFHVHDDAEFFYKGKRIDSAYALVHALDAQDDMVEIMVAPPGSISWASSDSEDPDEAWDSDRLDPDGKFASRCVGN